MSKKAMRPSKVMTLVITYNSEVSKLCCNIDGYPSNSVLICDNSTCPDHAQQIANYAKTYGIHYRSMRGNRGIAYAQNRGIEILIQMGADFVLFLDDDSRLSPSFIPELVSIYNDLSLDRKIAAVCAAPLRRTNENHQQLSKLSICSEMMSAGSLIPTEIINVVGLMDESLFIDYVDFDWGWRAQFQGFKIYTANYITFDHTLGEGVKSYLGLSLKIKNPVRHYYQSRNFIRLLNRPYVPASWKIKQALAAIVKCLAFSLLLPPRKKRLIYFARGVRDGFLGEKQRCEQTGSF